MPGKGCQRLVVRLVGSRDWLYRHHHWYKMPWSADACTLGDLGVRDRLVSGAVDCFDDRIKTLEAWHKE